VKFSRTLIAFHFFERRVGKREARGRPLFGRGRPDGRGNPDIFGFEVARLSVDIERSLGSANSAVALAKAGFERSRSLIFPFTSVPVLVKGFDGISNVSSTSIGSTILLWGDFEALRRRVGLPLRASFDPINGRFGFSMVAVEGLGIVFVIVASPAPPITEKLRSV